MDIGILDALLTTFRRSAFRLETLGFYRVEEEAEALQQYLGGDPLPKSANPAWCGMVRRALEDGREIKRVHLLPEALTPYLKFEIACGYSHSVAAGEQVYLLPASTLGLPADAPERDYWLFDDEVVVLMDYDRSGRLVSLTTRHDPQDLERYVKLSEALLERGISLKAFLASARVGGEIL